MLPCSIYTPIYIHIRFVTSIKVYLILLNPTRIMKFQPQYIDANREMDEDLQLEVITIGNRTKNISWLDHFTLKRYLKSSHKGLSSPMGHSISYTSHRFFSMYIYNLIFPLIFQQLSPIAYYIFFSSLLLLMASFGFDI